MIRYRFVFSKNTDASDMSFLKQIEYFKDFFISNFELYNGRKSKFSFGPALPFGYESEGEYVDVFLNQRKKEDEIKMIIAKNTLVGYALVSFKTIPLHFPSVESVLDAIEYEIYFAEKTSNQMAQMYTNTDKNMIVSSQVRGNVLNIILKKGLSLKMLSENAFKDIKFERIIRKKLYWQDLSGSLKII